jgi:hypothetical protein
MVVHDNVHRDVDDDDDDPMPYLSSDPADVPLTLDPTSIFWRFCTKHPRACLILRFPCLDSADHNFRVWSWIGYHYACLRAVRGQSDMSVSVGYQDHARRYVIDGIRSGLPVNLRFTLSEEFQITVKRLNEIPDATEMVGSIELVDQARRVF